MSMGGVPINQHLRRAKSPTSAKQEHPDRPSSSQKTEKPLPGQILSPKINSWKDKNVLSERRADLHRALTDEPAKEAIKPITSPSRPTKKDIENDLRNTFGVPKKQVDADGGDEKHVFVSHKKVPKWMAQFIDTPGQHRPYSMRAQEIEFVTKSRDRTRVEKNSVLELHHMHKMPLIVKPPVEDDD